MARAMLLIGFAAAASATNCGDTWGQNNNNGNNFGGMPVSNTPPESCKAMCSNTMQQPLCLGWTVLNNDDCYLKRDVDEMQYDSGVKGSGYCHPNCGDEQVHQNNDGHNYGEPFKVLHKEFCMMKCQADSRCEGWTVTNDGTCYLKDRVQPMRADDGVQASGYCAHR